jgi:hypothetical protein
MNAIEGLLGAETGDGSLAHSASLGLIDFAGLFPPAALDMHSAVRQYLEYSHGAYRRALGRFIINLEQFPYFWDAAGDYVRGLPLSVIVAPEADWDDLRRLLDKGYSIEAVEIKQTVSAAEVKRLAPLVPAGVMAYFETPVYGITVQMLSAVEAAGARVKLRLGGTSADAFPKPQGIAQILSELATRRMIFKATAGLHHAVRGRYPLTYAPESPTAVMHGFINLACAAAVLYFGGETQEAAEVLEEEWPGAWQVTPEAVAWRQNSWNADELGEVRKEFFAGFGSCSFEEPVRELEALKWL